MGGLEYQDPPGWTSVADQVANIPSGFVSTRIAASLPWIASIAPEVSTLAAESYSAWQRLYFTPAQIAAVGDSGPAADFDGDGIVNLLEFALNLDPTFNARVSMQPGSGLCGLPAVYQETQGATTRLTLEFVRRTSASGSGLTYTPQFSSDLVAWQSGGTATVTPLNPRWERVKVADSLSTAEAPKRFARLCVTLAE